MKLANFVPLDTQSIFDSLIKWFFLSPDLASKVRRAIDAQKCTKQQGESSCLALRFEGVSRFELELYRHITNARIDKEGFTTITEDEWNSYDVATCSRIRAEALEEFLWFLIIRFGYD